MRPHSNLLAPIPLDAIPSDWYGWYPVRGMIHEHRHVGVIYQILDPVSSEVRYIGQTWTHPYRRNRAHVSASWSLELSERGGFAAWVRDVTRNGLRVLPMEIVDAIRFVHYHRQTVRLTRANCYRYVTHPLPLTQRGYQQLHEQGYLVPLDPPNAYRFVPIVDGANYLTVDLTALESAWIEYYRHELCVPLLNSPHPRKSSSQSLISRLSGLSNGIS